MKEALRLVRDESMSVRKASLECNVPKSTLSDKLRERHEKTVGWPMVLSEAEEIIFKERNLLMGSWRYPITKVELQKLVKNYLDSRGRTVSVFKENKPGRDWTKAFLTRHQDVLTVRTANMLKRSRGNVNCEEV